MTNEEKQAQLEAAQAEMKTRLTKGTLRERNKASQYKARIKRQIEKAYGGPVRMEVVNANPIASVTVRNVLERLRSALESIEGLTPEQIQEKISALTQLLHLKLTLQVDAALDTMQDQSVLVKEDARETVKILMPFITQLNELNVKMVEALGLNENRSKLVPKREPLALPAGNWEARFGGTLEKKLPS
jgi:hypothetical protein